MEDGYKSYSFLVAQLWYIFNRHSDKMVNSLWPLDADRDINLCQCWLKQWLVAWWHQFITWTNDDSSLVMFSGIHLRTTLQGVPRVLFCITWDCYGRHKNCWSLRCSWSIACRRCSNYSFNLDLTPGFNALGQRQLQDERRNIEVWGFDASYIRASAVCYLSCLDDVCPIHLGQFRDGMQQQTFGFLGVFTHHFHNFFNADLQ